MFVQPANIVVTPPNAGVQLPHRNHWIPATRSCYSQPYAGMTGVVKR